MNKASLGCSHLTAANHESAVGRIGHQSGRMVRHNWTIVGILAVEEMEEELVAFSGNAGFARISMQSLVAAPRCFSRPAARDHLSLLFPPQISDSDVNHMS